MPLLDGRPPAVDTRFRPGNTFTVTFQWPAGALTDRTFTADLDATSLTLNVVGDDMVVSMTEAQTLAAATVGEFVLTETTGGISDVVITGSWHSSTGPSAGEATTVSVNESSGVVTITASAFPAVVSDLAVSGELTVPNPAPSGVANAAASIGEVEDLIAAEPAPGNRLDVSGGLVNVGPEVPTLRSMDPQSLSNVNNTTTETSVATGATLEAAANADNWMFRVEAGGWCKNTSGSAATSTIRLRCHDGTNDRIMGVWVMPLANDTAALRPWALSAQVEMTDFIGMRPCTVSQFHLSAGDTDTAKAQGSVNTTDTVTAGVALTWRVTVQHSAANANLQLSCTAASFLSAGPAV